METIIVCVLSFIAGTLISPFSKLNYAFGYSIGFCAGSVKTVDALRKRKSINENKRRGVK